MFVQSIQKSNKLLIIMIASSGDGTLKKGQRAVEVCSTYSGKSDCCLDRGGDLNPHLIINHGERILED